MTRILQGSLYWSAMAVAGRTNAYPNKLSQTITKQGVTVPNGHLQGPLTSELCFLVPLLADHCRTLSLHTLAPTLPANAALDSIAVSGVVICTQNPLKWFFNYSIFPKFFLQNYYFLHLDRKSVSHFLVAKVFPIFLWAEFFTFRKTQEISSFQFPV